jgi:hypothetical protein
VVIPAHDGSRAGNGSLPGTQTITGPVTGRHDPQALFTSESLGQALRQLEVYGRDGLPVLSADGHRVQGWGTSASVLRALAREVSGAHGEAALAQAAADWDRGDAQDTLSRPPTPLPGYQVIEIAIADGSPAVGRKLGDVPWPPASTPVSVLRGRQLRAPPPGKRTGPRRPRQPAHPRTAEPAARAPGRRQSPAARQPRGHQHVKAAGPGHDSAPGSVCSRGRAAAGAQVASRRRAQHGSSRTVFHEGSD